VVTAPEGAECHDSGRTLLDHFTFGNLCQPCAVLAVRGIPLRERIGRPLPAARWCAAMPPQRASPIILISPSASPAW
jgi:hypothetical protein